MWIVKIPKVYRPNGEYARFVGPFTSSFEAEKWAKETFVDFDSHVFVFHQVFKP